MGGEYFCEIENTQENWNKIYLDDDPLSAGCEKIVDTFIARVGGRSYLCNIAVEDKQEASDKIWKDKDPIGAGCKKMGQSRRWCVEGSAEEKVALQLDHEERECNTPLWMDLLPYCRHETEDNIYNWHERPHPWPDGRKIFQPELYVIKPYLYFFNNGEKRFRKNCTTLLAHFGEVYVE